MSVSFYNQPTQKYRINLDIDVLSDFNPHQIDWRKVLQLEPNETVESYTEDIELPDSY